MFKKKKNVLLYDKDKLTPILMSSICTGEVVAGFKDNETKKFMEVMLIRNDKDLREFMEKYGLDEVPRKEY